MRVLSLMLLAACSGSSTGSDTGYAAGSGEPTVWRELTVGLDDMMPDGTVVGDRGLDRPTSHFPEIWPSAVTGRGSRQAHTDAGDVVILGNHVQYPDHRLFRFDAQTLTFAPLVEEPIGLTIWDLPRAPHVSADGRSVAMSTGNNLLSIDTETGERTTLYGDGSTTGVELSWMAEDGEYMAVDTRFQEPTASVFLNGRMRLYDRDGSFETLEILDSAGEPYPESLAPGIQAPLFSEDRSRLVFAQSYFGSCHLYLYDRDSRELTELLGPAVNDLTARQEKPESNRSITQVDATPDLSVVAVGLMAVSGGASGFNYDAASVVVIETATGHTRRGNVEIPTLAEGVAADNVTLRADGGEVAYTDAYYDDVQNSWFFITQSIREDLWLDLPSP